MVKEEFVVNQFPAQLNREDSKPSDSLTERLDPSIGEASTVMGAMITELLRRTLRGGVSRIGEGLDAYVNEKVDSTIADRTPAIEQAAVEVAENAARVAATEVAHEEVHALERRTKETSEQLAAQIEETARTAQKTAEEKARDLGSRIESAEKKAEQEKTLAVQQLVQQIEIAEKRVGEHSHTRMTQHVDEIMERSRKGTMALKSRLQSLESSLEEAQARLRAELAVLAEANQALKVRIVELEKPRGLRGLFARIFSRKKKVELPA
jgi:chromosome segregation ATPase